MQSCSQLKYKHLKCESIPSMLLHRLSALAGFVFTAVTLIVVGDTAGKLLTAGAVPTEFVAWSRFALAALIFLPFSGLKRTELRSLVDWRILLRSCLIVGGILSILSALKTEPIANVFGAFFISPIVSYCLAVAFLGERPALVRALLLALGFLGVLLVVKPGFGASTGMFFALAAGACHGAYLATTRWIAAAFRPRFLLFSQLLVGAVILAPLAAGSTEGSYNSTQVFLILVSALGSAAGNYMLVIAHRAQEASVIAPLVYSQLIAATAIGVAVFGEWPDGIALLGLAITATSGLASLLFVKRSQ